jgi:NF-X1-type zinc finger protein NFXL1
MPTSKDKSLKGGQKDVHQRFEEIHSKNLVLLKERIEKNECDSSENDENSDVESNDMSKNKLENLFRDYKGNDIEVTKFQEYFGSFESDCCLICLRNFKSKDKIFSCKKCYCILHLLCIQKWANDSINLKKMWHDQQPAGYYDNQGNFIKKKKLELCFDCPACRHKYEDFEIPRHYECFCGKERDPVVQDWLIAHSCGNLCLKPLENECGHKCMLLCHPGKNSSEYLKQLLIIQFFFLFNFKENVLLAHKQYKHHANVKSLK